MRRRVITLLATLLLLLGLGAVAVATGGGSSVTRPRLERSLPLVFSRLYVQQAALLGRTGSTPASLQARAMCDKHGPDGPDVGPGGDWVCLMSWQDPAVPMPTEGYGRFELNVHSNDCYTASGPTKLTGFLTITDTHGQDVTNPVFEFDGCFDPHGDDRPTGVFFPSLLSVTSSTLTRDGTGHTSVQLTCGTGAAGCAGTIAVAAGSTPLGSVPFDLREENAATLPLPVAIPPGAEEVTLTVTPTTGVGPSPVTVPVS